MRAIHSGEGAGTRPQTGAFAQYRPEAVLGAAGIGLWEWEPPGDSWRVGADVLRTLEYGDLPPGGAFETRGGMLHAGDRARVAAELADFLAGEKTSYTVEYRAICGGGALALVEETGVAVHRAGSGAPLLVAGTIRVVWRLSAGAGGEAAAPDTAVRLRRDVLEAAPWGCLLLDEGMRLLDANAAAASLFGFASREEMLAGFGACADAAPDTGPAAFTRCLLEALQADAAQFEMELESGDARTPLHVTCKRVAWGDAGAVAAYVADLPLQEPGREELLRRNRLLQAVNRAAARLAGADTKGLREAMNGSLRAIARAVDARRMYIWENYEEAGALWARQLFEWSADSGGEDTGELSMCTPYDDIPYWRDRLAVGRGINKLVSQLPREERAPFQSQGIRSVLVLPVHQQGRFWGFVGLNSRRDWLPGPDEVQILQAAGNLLAGSILREQANGRLIRTSEAALAGTRAKSDFLSRMSHEIRTPMNAIIGMTALARKAEDLERCRLCLEKIDNASRQLLGIINDVLDMSKIESGKFDISRGPFDFEKTVQNICNVIQVKMEEKRIDFQCEFQDLFTRLVVSDELRLSQVIINLLGNAVKFTPEGGAISLKARHRPREEAPGVSVLRVEVRDTGIGVSSEQAGRLFDSYQQADDGIARRFGGTGLGLAICKKIVNLMGGDIWVESVVGEGSCFLFEVDIAWGDPRLNQQAGAGDSARILVVDDNGDTREYLHQILTGYEIACTATGSGDGAVELVRRSLETGTPYDIIFLDWGAPGKTVGEIARGIRRIAGDAALVVMSVADWSQIEGEAAGLGIRQFLQKPVLPSVLYNTVVELTQRSYVQSGEAGSRVWDWSDKRILVVEDIEINREILVSVLEDSNVCIDCAENGLAAVEAVERDPRRYDLILMDVQMPVLDGLAATGRIRALPHAWAKKMPIVAMTANAFKEDVQECIASGMDNHIAKPIDVEELTEKLAQYLGGSVRQN